MVDVFLQPSLLRSTLHLKPSNAEELFGLPVAAVERYQLIDDLLFACPMTNGQLYGAVVVVNNRFYEKIRTRITSILRGKGLSSVADSLELRF